MKRDETRAQREARLTAFERDERPNRKTSYNWQLNRVDDIDWIKDTSGIYCLINWDVKTDTVRLDIMSDNHEPIISFAGASDNVRKAFGRWVDSRISQKTSDKISASHIAYIGSQLQLADVMRIDYIQDGEYKKTSDNPFDVPASLLTNLLRDRNKKAADDIVEKYNRQILDEEQFDFMIVLDATRFVKFERKIDSTIALACSSMYYLHECPETNRVFLCQAGIDNNIAELKNVKEFQNWLNSDVR